MVTAFRLGAIVGAGAHAEVRLARAADDDGVWLALKRPRPDGGAEADACVRAEAALLPRLSHPGIVPLHAADAVSGAPFVATLWLPGGDLRRRIGRPAPAASEIARRLMVAAGALDWMHEHGLVHGDVKPANLVLDETGLARLIDFGSTGCGAYATRAYAAPERLLGLASDARDDVFSLAAVIWALLAGRPPFGAGAMAHLDDPPPPPSLPRRAWPCLRAALAPSRAARPRTATEVVAACAEAACPA